MVSAFILKAILLTYFLLSILNAVLLLMSILVENQNTSYTTSTHY